MIHEFETDSVVCHVGYTGPQQPSGQGTQLEIVTQNAKQSA